MQSQRLGRSRGGLTTKLRVVTDGQGRSTKPPTWRRFVRRFRCRSALIAERSYDASKRVRAWLRQRRIRAVIPRRRGAAGRRNRRRGRPPQVPAEWYAQHKQHNAVERFFG